MSVEIELVTESGKWKRVTTTDDELFRPILGAMVEEGMIMPSTLVFTSSVAEILEQDWHFLQLLYTRMVWYGYTTENDMILCDTCYLRAGGECQPPALLWRHQLTRLRQLLDLPWGWEEYVVVDTHTPKEEYVDHMNGVYDLVSCTRSETVVREALTTEAKELLKTTADDPKPLLLPFLYNLYLQMEHESLCPHIFMSDALTRLDWHIVEKYLAEKNPFFRSKPYNLSKIMQGRGYMNNHDNDYIQTLCISSNRLMCLGTPEAHLIKLYSLLLPRMNNYYSLGLEPILGYKKTRALLPSSTCARTNTDIPLTGSGLSKLVGWVNAVILTYPTMSRGRADKKQSKEGVLYTPTCSRVRLARKDFSTSVELLGKTVGLRAMRTILNALTRVRSDMAYNKAEVKKNERVGEYISLLHKYLKSHYGENTDVKRFCLV